MHFAISLSSLAFHNSKFSFESAPLLHSLVVVGNWLTHLFSDSNCSPSSLFSSRIAFCLDVHLPSFSYRLSTSSKSSHFPFPSVLPFHRLEKWIVPAKRILALWRRRKAWNSTMPMETISRNLLASFLISNLYKQKGSLFSRGWRNRRQQRRLKRVWWH